MEASLVVVAATPQQPGSPRQSKKAMPRLARTLSQKAGLGKTKVLEVDIILGRAGTVGLGKAVEVLDTLGSTMTSLNTSSGFVSSSAKGNKISILAFEVASTIVKGSNLMCSLSKANIKHIKEVVLHSEGVQHLISKYMDELLEIAASDKRFGVENGVDFCDASFLKDATVIHELNDYLKSNV